MLPRDPVSSWEQVPAETRDSVDTDSPNITKAGTGKRFVPRTTAGVLRAILLLTLIPFLLLQTAIYFLWYQTRRNTEINANTEIARSVSSAFDSYVRDIRRQELVTGEALKTGKSLSLQYAGTLLYFLKSQNPTVVRFSLVDQEGVVRASTDPKILGLSVADRSYFRELTRGQEWTISDLTEAPEIANAVFSVSSRVEAGDGSWYVILALVDPDQLRNLVLSLERPLERAFTLFDRQGNLVFYSGTLRTEHSNWKSSDVILRRCLELGQDATGSLVYPMDKKDHFASRVPVRGFGWVAGASRPVGMAMAPIYRTIVWIALLNGAIIGISLLGAFGLSRFLIGRLDQLRESARRIAKGDFSSAAEIRIPVELAELENSLKRMADQIQTRQESLEKAVRDLTRSNQELEQFAYVASHDIQEPLRVITGFVQLLESRYKGQLDKDADRYIGFITDAVSRQQELIRGVLAFARLGRHSVQLEPVDANLAANAAVQNIRYMIEDAKADVTHDELPVVRADKVQLVQLFQNLVGNGVKFRRPGNPGIHISAQTANGTCTFAVKDNGIGIEPQYWEQIFTMFKRLHTRKEYPGTGIGLAICKKIVELHGGRIWVDSKPGEGSTFYFTLMAAGESNNECDTRQTH